MTSPATQFAPSRQMGIYDSLHHISMWEDAFKGDISPNTDVSVISQVDAMLKNKVKMDHVCYFYMLRFGL